MQQFSRWLLFNVKHFRIILMLGLFLLDLASLSCGKKWATWKRRGQAWLIVSYSAATKMKCLRLWSAVGDTQRMLLQLVPSKINYCVLMRHSLSTTMKFLQSNCKTHVTRSLTKHGIIHLSRCAPRWLASRSLVLLANMWISYAHTISSWKWLFIS